MIKLTFLLLTLFISFVKMNKFLFLKNDLELIIAKFLRNSMFNFTENIHPSIFLSSPNSNSENSLNISDFSFNALAYMGYRAIKLDKTIRNDSSNPLATLPMDTDDLAILIKELKTVYANENLNMTLRVYIDPSKHKAPSVSSNVDGMSIILTIGIEFGVINKGSVDSELIFSVDMPMQIKIQFESSTDQKLKITISSITVINVNQIFAKFAIDLNSFSSSLDNFLKVASDQITPMIQSIDILQQINKLSGLSFTKFNIVTAYKCLLITLI